MEEKKRERPGITRARREAIIRDMVAWNLTTHFDERNQKREAIKEKFGIGQRAFEMWTAKIRDLKDPDVVATVLALNDGIQERWVDEISETLVAGVDFLKRALAPGGLDIGNPQAVHSAVGAIKILAETDMSLKLMEFRLSQRDAQEKAARRENDVPAEGCVVPLYGAANAPLVRTRRL